MRTLVIALILLLAAPGAADIISINSGGDDNIVINSDFYIEGFFTDMEEIKKKW